MYFVDCDHQSELFQIAQSIRPLFDRAHQGASPPIPTYG